MDSVPDWVVGASLLQAWPYSKANLDEQSLSRVIARCVPGWWLQLAWHKPELCYYRKIKLPVHGPVNHPAELTTRELIKTTLTDFNLPPMVQISQHTQVPLRVFWQWSRLKGGTLRWTGSCGLNYKRIISRRLHETRYAERSVSGCYEVSCSAVWLLTFW